MLQNINIYILYNIKYTLFAKSIFTHQYLEPIYSSLIHSNSYWDLSIHVKWEESTVITVSSNHPVSLNKEETQRGGEGRGGMKYPKLRAMYTLQTCL